jgi:hypothetical protein
MVHPGQSTSTGQQYYVQELDLENNWPSLSRLDWIITRARRRTDHGPTKLAETEVRGGIKANGDIQVTSQVIGFKKLRWMTNENLGDEPLDMPATNLQTTGYWIGLSEATLALRQTGADQRSDVRTRLPTLRRVRPINIHASLWLPKRTGSMMSIIKSRFAVTHAMFHPSHRHRGCKTRLRT